MGEQDVRKAGPWSAVAVSAEEVLQAIGAALCYHLTTILFGCLILLVIIYKLRWSRQKFTKELPTPTNVLFVIAHPDDEVMFFGPVLVNMVKKMKNRVYVLCLSTGGFDGKGLLRQGELWRSCKKLGMLEANITMLKYDDLQDNASIEWSVDLLARVLENHILAHSIDMVITFDEKGVSGHANHVACYNAVKKLIAQSQLPEGVRVFLLESVNLFRKYCSNVFDIVISCQSSDYTYLATWSQRCTVVAGMKCHSSQLTWYRRLYLIFSRYIVINSLRELKVKKVTK